METPVCCLQSRRGDSLHPVFMNPDCVCKPLKSVLVAVSHYNTSLGNGIPLNKKKKPHTKKPHSNKLKIKKKKPKKLPTTNHTQNPLLCAVWTTQMVFLGRELHASVQGRETLLHPWLLWHRDNLSCGLLVPSLCWCFVCGPGFPLSVHLVTGMLFPKSISINFSLQMWDGGDHAI